METSLNVLITGACGVTSRAVVRSLKESDKFKDCRFIGADVSYNEYGLYEGLYDKLYRMPWTTDKAYPSMMERILQDENIGVALILPELEVMYWTENPFNTKFFNPPLEFSRLAISKQRLYDFLSGTDLVPKHQIISKKALATGGSTTVELKFPLWIRDYAEGTTSGKGSFMAKNYGQLKAWLEINPGTDSFMLSEYLPGRNYGCFLLYEKGRLLKAGVLERLAYYMSQVSISGITGNAAKGKLINEKPVVERADEAVRKICEHTGEKMNGLVVVDMRGDENELPQVTEINIKHAATTSSLSMGGFNISEYHLLCALGRSSELSPEVEIQFPPNNLFLRDIDGLPVYVEDYKELKIGESR